MAIIGIFLDRRVSVDLARAISVILQVTFIVASATRNDASYQDGGREFPCSAHLAVAF